MDEFGKRIVDKEYINISLTGEGEFDQGDKIKFDRVDVATDGIELQDNKEDILFKREGIYLLSFWISFQQINVPQPPMSYAVQFRDQNSNIKASAGMLVNIDDSVLYTSMKCSAIMRIEKNDSISLFNECQYDIRLSTENGYSGELSIARLGSDITTEVLALASSSDMDNIMPGDTVNFDTVQFSRGIEYEDGIITIKQDGLYLVNWIGTGALNEMVPDGCNVGGIGFSLVRRGIQLVTSGQLVGNDFFSSMILGEGLIMLKRNDEIYLVNTGSVCIDIEGVNGSMPIALGIIKVG